MPETVLRISSSEGLFVSSIAILQNLLRIMAWDNWGKVFKNGPSKICEKPPLKV